MRPRRIDVFQAPHHGSKASNVPALAEWARPRVAVSSQGPPRGPGGVPEPYTATGGAVPEHLGRWGGDNP